MPWKSLALALLLFPALLSAADLRGRVVRADPYQGTVAAGGVRFTLQNQSAKAVAKAVFSGGDGFYYLYNVGPGSYRLTYDYVSKRTMRPMQGTIALTVGNGRTQDIAQIVIRD